MAKKKPASLADLSSLLLNTLNIQSFLVGGTGIEPVTPAV